MVSMRDGLVGSASSTFGNSVPSRLLVPMIIAPGVPILL